MNFFVEVGEVLDVLPRDEDVEQLDEDVFVGRFAEYEFEDFVIDKRNESRCFRGVAKKFHSLMVCGLREVRPGASLSLRPVQLHSGPAWDKDGEVSREFIREKEKSVSRNLQIHERKRKICTKTFIQTAPPSKKNAEFLDRSAQTPHPSKKMGGGNLNGIQRDIACGRS